jgi:hypothetical protein
MFPAFRAVRSFGEHPEGAVPARAVVEDLEVPDGRRLWMAMPSALVAREADGEVSMDHSTTRREKASRTAAQ